MSILRSGLVVLLIFAVGSFGFPACAEPQASVHMHPFGAIGSGQKADLYVLTNGRGMVVAISNFGATIVSIKVPDRSGRSDDVVLGFDTAGEYENGKAHFGGTIGRYANRIAHGKFSLDGQTFTLPQNNGDNTLHGGILGFDKKVWAARELQSKNGAKVQFTYVSADGEEGFPGTLTATVVFTLNKNKNELEIDYRASTDKNTVINLTNHSYFNLAGQGSGDILAMLLQINAGKFTPVDATQIPTGELRDVQDTPFDFRKAAAIGARINASDEQLRIGHGYDQNFVLDRKPGSAALLLAATARDPKSGRMLEILTTEPAVQLYTGNFLDAGVRGKGGATYPPRSAFCLETQHFPDSPNHANFPSTTLTPGKEFNSTTIFRFSVK